MCSLYDLKKYVKERNLLVTNTVVTLRGVNGFNRKALTEPSQDSKKIAGLLFTMTASHVSEF